MSSRPRFGGLENRSTIFARVVLLGGLHVTWGPRSIGTHCATEQYIDMFSSRIGYEIYWVVLDLLRLNHEAITKTKQYMFKLAFGLSRGPMHN